MWLSEIPTSSEELIISDICKAVHDSYLIVDQVGETVFVSRFLLDIIHIYKYVVTTRFP